MGRGPAIRLGVCCILTLCLRGSLTHAQGRDAPTAPAICAATDDDGDDFPIETDELAGYYMPCGDPMSVQCRGELQCITFGARKVGLCLPPCLDDLDCPTQPGPSACSVTLTDGGQVCAVDCLGSRCPDGTTCGKWNGSYVCANW